ncbi:hypothetical protein MOO46_01015 [Apilactobacillus apisilvae]|uniref:Prepilin-type N-terminal cleavage/methylation domain-containing protein n=1 Tax=Apilactobacillus apisilvae TaxID=2923364 RepID=A0ABY4PHG7_9LACO|nr:hypothetical protein [Apilactobacillus apisilvae]UQS85214.1 hypothetical protein MOO46_01015 [Apilactobacillus apisilvae]
MKIIKLLKNKTDGFTSIEMIIVMALTATFLSFTIFIYQTTNSYHRNDESAFWNAFKHQWDSVLTATKLTTHANVTSSIVVTKDEVNFYYWNNIKKKIKVPETLEIYSSSYKINIKSGGYVAPSTYRWKSKISGDIYKQTFQLGWGIYHLEKE